MMARMAAIAADDPRAADVRALLGRHLAFAHATTAPEDVFALDVDALADPAVAFFSCRDDDGERTEFVMFTLWDSIDAIKAFAGDDHETAVFYPEDDKYLLERDLRSTHFEVHTHAAPEA